jgi:hypothetical protein
MGFMEEKPETIRQVSEKEIWVGKNKFYLIDDKIKVGKDIIFLDDDILNVILHGEHDLNSANAIKDICIELTNKKEGKVNILIDLNEAGKSTPEAREIWKELAENNKADRIAFYGLHPVARVLAMFTIKATNKKNIYFFKNRKKALDWLKE